MMTQAFYSGISGVKTHSAGIDIVSDNLANVSTVGYRGNDYEFSSLFDTMVNTTEGSVNSTVGIGTQLSATPMMEGIGSEILSDRSTDMAILGNGWFGVQGEGKPLYTRDGNFTFDKNDDLVTPDGYHVLGTMGGNIKDGVLTKTLSEIPLGSVAAQEKLNFPKSLAYPPEASTIAKFDGNIGTETNVQTMGATVIDANSDKNDLRLEFTKKDIQNPPGTQWNVKAVVKSLDGKTVYDTKTGSVAFDERGALISSTLSTINNNGSTVKIDLGTGFNGVVSIGNVETSSSSVADGTIGGDLQGYDINRNGEVVATFTNGRQSSVGKIAVYHFTNEQGLNRQSGTRFSESSNSGQAMFFKDAQGKNILGTDITNFKLEGSNVTMEYGLTELIILQRSYDANAKSITTADQMMQKALNMGA
ncbi:flagellar hook protein FlgE [Sulfurimonas sp.]|uniref:flagellar hook protein FlgE n=1 Tax=Sulfurimonas sp. TaxID=2022749 RepID=UPI002627AE96|nr:flagellar hook-basal body complex protein [Sulfurimonas sp.]